jgi:hypothetical protein
MPDWRMKGEYVKNCSCAAGCPCDFWAAPTHHYCTGMLGMRVNEGHFDKTRLDGVVWAVTYHWPGPLHEGNGTLQPFIDSRTNEAQRNALLTILSGKVGNAWFEVVASIVTTIHEPQFVPIEFDFDLNKRRARVAIAGQFETRSGPIRNIVTGDEHRVLVDMPNGMEYSHPEIASAEVLRSTGKIAFDCPGAHSSLAAVEHTHKGLVHHRAVA